MPLELANSSQNIVSQFVDDHLRTAIKQAGNHPERTKSPIKEVYGLMAASFEDAPTYLTIVDVLNISPQQPDTPTVINGINIITSVSCHITGNNVDEIAPWLKNHMSEMIIIKSDKRLVTGNFFDEVGSLKLSNQIVDQLLTQSDYRNEIMASKSGIKDMPLTTTLLADATTDNNQPDPYLFQLISNLHDANVYIY